MVVRKEFAVLADFKWNDPNISNISLGDISMSDLVHDGTETSEFLNMSALLDITNEQPVPVIDGDGQCLNPCGSELVSEIKENSSITSNAGSCNRSFPGDDDEDVLPYPVPVLRKKKTTT